MSGGNSSAGRWGHSSPRTTVQAGMSPSDPTARENRARGKHRLDEAAPRTEVSLRPRETAPRRGSTRGRYGAGHEGRASMVVPRRIAPAEVAVRSVLGARDIGL